MTSLPAFLAETGRAVLLRNFERNESSIDPLPPKALKESLWGLRIQMSL